MNVVYIQRLNHVVIIIWLLKTIKGTAAILVELELYESGVLLSFEGYLAHVFSSYVCLPQQGSHWSIMEGHKLWNSRADCGRSVWPRSNVYARSDFIKTV